MEEAAGLERSEQQACVLGLLKVHASDKEDGIEAHEGQGQDQRQEQVAAEPARSNGDASADQHPGKPQHQGRRGEQGSQVPDADAGTQAHADGAGQQQVAGGGEEAADDRIGDIAGQEAQAHDAEAPGQQAGKGGGDGDQHGDGGHEPVALIGGPGIRHGACRDGEDNCGHILRMADRAPEAVEETAHGAHQRRTQQRQAKPGLEQRRQGAAIDDRGERDDEGDGEGRGEKGCPYAAQD